VTQIGPTPHPGDEPIKTLTLATAALSIAAWLPLAASAQNAMKISISIGQNSHQGIGIDVFAKEVEKRTGGRYKIQTFYSGSLAASVKASKRCNWARRS